jgi:DNA/RNA-binding domain of Phe-tRNA-synthetase-like protein
MLEVDPVPGLRLAAFTSEFPAPLGELATPPAVLALFDPGAPAPLERDEGVRAAVRDLLRGGGYKPTGRGKPASEYLARAAAEGALGSINLAVDVLNAVSLHSGLPISVVDLDRVKPPFRVGLAAPGSRYVFNASGQEIDVSGLICLLDAEGPCAGPVKDSQRTKTGAGTRRTLSIVWGASALGDRTERAAAWYRGLLGAVGARVEGLFLAP